MSKSEEAEALRAAILAYMHKCNKEVLADVLATILEGKTLADLPEHLRSRFEEVSVAPGTVNATSCWIPIPYRLTGIARYVQEPRC